MYAFVSHESACEALRQLSRAGAMPDRWPWSPCRLPSADACVSGQRDFRNSGAEKSLRALGCVSTPVDLLVPAQAARSSGKAARFHVWSGVLPAGSLLAVGPDVLVSGPELAVIQLCSVQGKLDALLDAHVDAVRAETGLLADLGLDDRPVVDHPLEWERVRRLVSATVVASEFAGTYRLGWGDASATYGLRPLMSAESLEHVIAEVGESPGTRRARRVRELMVEGSASPLETSLALMLTLPVEFGGFGLAKPLLNRPIDVSAYRGSLSDRDEVSPDFLWAERRVALEYDSAEFHGGRDRSRSRTDAVRANILATLGYCVLRATPDTIRSLPDLTLLAHQVAHVLGVELAPTTPLQSLRRRKLYMQLMPSVRREA